MWEILVQVRELGSCPKSLGVRGSQVLVELGEEKVWRAIQIPAFSDPLPFPRLPLLLLVNPVLCRMAYSSRTQSACAFQYVTKSIRSIAAWGSSCSPRGVSMQDKEQGTSQSTKLS